MGKTDKQLKQIGQRIKNYRELKGFSQSYMSQKLHISSSAYSRIERNEVNIPLDKLIQIAEVLNISLEKVLFGDDYEKDSMMANEMELEYKQKFIESSKLLKAYQEQIELLKDQVDYLKAIIAKK
jgi:transcriptional regulator with XRE-family HTH domain